MSHNVSLERRSGNTFSPILSNEAVKPREAIRISAHNAMPQTVEFRITGIHYPEQVVFGPRSATVGVTSGEAYLDISAPGTEGSYYLKGYNKLLGIAGGHEAEHLLFRVAADAPPPPSEPPATGILGGFNIPSAIGDVKTIGIVAVIALGLIMLGPKLRGK